LVAVLVVLTVVLGTPACAVALSPAGPMPLGVQASSEVQRPEVTGISPSQALAGDLDFTLTVVGSDFVQGSTVLWNGENRDTGFISSTMLTATVRSDDVLVAGTAYVSVSNPGPGGGQSLTARTFTVINPAPQVVALEPDRAWAGAQSFPLTVSGSGFTPTSVVQIAGIDQSTRFIDSGKLMVDVPVEALRWAVGLSVRVYTPPPGGGLSSSQFLWIYDDSIPPVTTAEGLSSLWNRRAVTLTLEATDVGRGVERTFFRVGAKGEYSAGNKVRISAPLDHSNDGLHVVQFFSIDAVLNWEEPAKEVTVGIDTTPPTTTVAQATVTRGQLLVPRYRVYDPVSPKGRDALLQVIDRSNKVVLRSFLGEPSMRTWQTGKGVTVDLPKGRYKMRVLAHDLAGNAQSSTRSAVLTVT